MNNKCMFCEKTFSRKSGLKNHINKGVCINPKIVTANIENNPTNNIQKLTTNMSKLIIGGKKAEHKNFTLKQSKIDEEKKETKIPHLDIGHNTIYLIRLREHITMNEDIFKVGKSTNITQRMTQYPKDSQVLIIIAVNDCHTFEKEIINILRQKFINRRDIGSEYFQGDYRTMINEIMNLNYQKHR